MSLKRYIYYHDVRRFGFWHVITTQELDKKLEELGPDILQQRELPIKDIVKRFRRYNNQNICIVLMNGKTLSGIGNYIKSEILYRTRVAPLAQVSNISDAVLYQLYHEASSVALQA